MGYSPTERSEIVLEGYTVRTIRGGTSKKAEVRREAAVTSVHLPVFPTPTMAWAEKPDRSKGIDLSGANTRPMNLFDARNNGYDVSISHRDKYLHGDKSAPLDLLCINPRFIAEPWIQSAFRQLSEEHLFHIASRKRGRKWGGTNFSRHLLVGIVWKLSEKMGGVEYAIRYLQTREEVRRLLGLSADRIRQLFYDTARNARCIPLYINGPWQVMQENDPRIKESMTASALSKPQTYSFPKSSPITQGEYGIKEVVIHPGTGGMKKSRSSSKTDY